MDGQSPHDQTIEARKDYFHPAWFAALLKGELGLGDTFWIGNYGVGLVFMPIIVLVLMFGPMVLPATLATWLGQLLLAALALYFLLLTRAVWTVARRTPESGGWRWVGVVLTALQVLSTLAILAT